MYNAYSPSVLKYKGVKRLWFGGWLTREDVGPDKIYYSQFENGAWSRPSLAFAPEGYHVNDPSVIIDPRDGNHLLMYYTALSNQFTSFEDITQHSVVGLAASKDGGKTWTNKGIIIGQQNGIDMRGAWSPSALVVGDQIWLYYHTNGPGPIDIYRTRLDISRQTAIGTERTFLGRGNGSQLTGINVDVSRRGALYVLLVSPSPRSIVRYVGEDGIHWYTPVDQPNPIITAQPGELIATPTLYVDEDGAIIYYSVGHLPRKFYDSMRMTRDIWTPPNPIR